VHFTSQPSAASDFARADISAWHGFPATPKAALLLAAAAILVLPLASTVSAPAFLRDQDSYLQVHTFIEFFAIGVSILVAGIGWNAVQRTRSGHMPVVAAGFLAVGLLDLGHLLSYSGMPALVTPAGPEKAIFFWLAARIACAATLLVVVVTPEPGVEAEPRFRRWAAGVSLAYTGAVYYVVLWHPDALPHTFIPGEGLMRVKIIAEYAVMGLFATTAALLWKSMARSTFRGPPLLAALLIFVASEVALTLYSSVHDIYNFVGHLYKVAGTYLIYRAVFIDAVQWPYLRLRSSEERYRKLLQQAADSILLIDAGGRILGANQRAEVMTDSSRNALIGRRIEELIPGWADPGHKPVDPSITAIWESRLTASHRPDITVEVSTRQLDTGEIQAIIRDISERKASEAKLRTALAMAEQTTKAKSAFLANMSHELRTPLNAVLGFSEMIRNQVIGNIGDQRYSEYAADIHAAGTHLLDIVNDVLDIARIESGRFELVEGEVDLKALGDECLRLTQPSAGSIAIRISQPAGELTVRADARALRQILLNLLSNAVKFTPAGGRIEIVTGIAANGCCEISVQDTGIGIAEKDLPHVTEAFMQVESTYAREHQGSGLGLAISKALIELHGGTLSVASKLGIGTTVTVMLPHERLRLPTLAALA
jgi:PAS domain S-box-containing protein